MVDQHPSSQTSRKTPSPAHQAASVVPWCDRDRTSSYTAEHIRLALALADAHILRSLLSSCTPPIAPAPRIGHVSTCVSAPAGDLTADGIITFEAIHCSLATVGLNPPVDNFASHRRWSSPQRHYETPLYTLAKSIPIAQAAAVLRQAQIPAEQVQGILKLPRQAWHKSWWYSHNSPLPFQRYMRCRRYDDGTITLQYKDYFEQEPPPCFHSQIQRVLVVLQQTTVPFGLALARINQLRQRLSVNQAILIDPALKATAVEGFIRQNISLYPVTTLANPINCAMCNCGDCPLQGQSNSPVTGCDRFQPNYSQHQG